eukprot:11337423-Alexandrium_andersonii.AAC.1
MIRTWSIRAADRQPVPGLRLTKASEFDPATANCRRLPNIQRSPGSRMTTVSNFVPAPHELPQASANAAGPGIK